MYLSGRTLFFIMYDGSGSIPSTEQKAMVEVEAGSKGTEKMLVCTLKLYQRAHKEMKKNNLLEGEVKRMAKKINSTSQHQRAPTRPKPMEPLSVTNYDPLPRASEKK